jgi:hypothetical protein
MPAPARGMGTTHGMGFRERDLSVNQTRPKDGYMALRQRNLAASSRPVEPQRAPDTHASSSLLGVLTTAPDRVTGLLE